MVCRQTIGIIYTVPPQLMMQRSQKLLKRRDNGSFLLQSVSKAAPTTTKTASDSALIRCKSNRSCLLFLKRRSNQVTQACIHLNASFAGSYIELHVIIIYLTMLIIYLLLLMIYLFLLIIYLPLLTICLILYWLCIAPNLSPLIV